MVSEGEKRMYKYKGRAQHTISLTVVPESRRRRLNSHPSLLAIHSTLSTLDRGSSLGFDLRASDFLADVDGNALLISPSSLSSLSSSSSSACAVLSLPCSISSVPAKPSSLLSSRI